MKKIKFGFSNDKDPKGSWEGIGIKPGLLLHEADYYGAIKYEDDSYIVAKVTTDEYNRYPHLVGNFIVRPAIADMYVDGSGTIYLDQEQSMVAKQLEDVLNKPQIRDRINGFEDILNNFSKVYAAHRTFLFLTMGESFLTTSITHEAFENKNEALKNCRQSFSELQQYYQMNQENSFRR